MLNRAMRLSGGLIVAAVLATACGEASPISTQAATLKTPVRALSVGPPSAAVVEAPVDASILRAAAPEPAMSRIDVAEEHVSGSRPPPLSPAAAIQFEPGAVRVEAETPSAISVRKTIRTGSLAIVVVDVRAAVREIQAILDAVPGAFVAQSSIQEDEPPRVSTVTVRIPAAEFDRTLRAVRAIGVRVVNEDVRSQDVTAAYTDLEARLRNAQATEMQLRDILRRAQSVDDTLDVQRELASVRERIEVLQGQLNVLRNQTDLATLTVTLHLAPDLRVTRDLPSTPVLHENVELGALVENLATVDARDVRVNDRLDAGMIFVSASGDGTYDPQTHQVTWTLPRLEPGERHNLTTVVRLEGDGADLNSHVSLTPSESERNPANNAAVGRLSFHVDLSVDKDGATAVPVGREAEYVLTFRNRGTADAVDVRLEEALPSGMTFVRAAGGGRFDGARHTVVWDFARLQPLAEKQVSYVARVDRAEGRLQTDTQITSAQLERTPLDNLATTYLTALPEPLVDRDVWTPANTLRDGVETLAGVGRWIADGAITLAIVGGPVLIVATLLAVPVGVVWRRRRAARTTAGPA